MARLINLKLFADFFNKIGQEETSRAVVSLNFIP